MSSTSASISPNPRARRIGDGRRKDGRRGARIVPKHWEEWWETVHRAFKVVACGATALFVAHCSPTDVQYYREGIGTDLYWSDLPSTTDLQDVYLDYLCRQASPLFGVGVAPVCGAQAPLPQNLWPQIVQAGMNDIDLRCDSYLSWLDQKKRFNGVFTQEISDIRTITESIVSVTPGVGPRTIAAVGAVFGIASHTFTNVNSFLLQVDHSTVQAVVFGRRDKFRTDIADRRIDNKPEAIHALRLYLDICMPMTIATDINITATVFQQGKFAALTDHPLVSTSTIGVPLTARQPLPVSKNPGTIPGCKGPQECALGASDVINLQSLLCLPEDGSFGPQTRTGISIYQDIRHFQINGQIGPQEAKQWLKDFAQFGGCNMPFQNFYEREALNTAEKINALKAKLLVIVPDPPIPTGDGKLDQMTRDKITAARGKLTMLKDPVTAVPKGQMTRALNVAIDNAAASH
jgi:hypothetical protein